MRILRLTIASLVFMMLTASVPFPGFQQGMKMKITENLGGGGSLCASGYSALTGSDSNYILDSTGGYICCPD